MNRVIIIAMLLAVILSGCGSALKQADAFDNPNRFRVEAGSTGLGVWLVTDRDTGVQYLVNTKGGAVMLTDKDGNPYIANGWRDNGT